MSYNAWPGHGDFVEESFVKEMLPDLWQKLLDDLAEMDKCLNEVAALLDVQREDNTNFEEDEEAKIRELWEKMQATFKEKTGGLELDMFYFCPECESRANEINAGVNFYVGGVFDYTPAGRKFKDHITTKSWVDFG